ncbi:hypothetical protein DMC63_13350 [Streptomyces sp. WAC 05977]|nr:hypothetical protein DMC63_13350 [Streptomyces sp. WAC 05977]
MPRRSPARVRRGLSPRHPADFGEGFSPALTAGLARLERSRNYLGPGATRTALRLWREFVANPYWRLRVDSEGCGVWECCGDPWQSKEMLEGVALALPAGLAKEMRRHIAPEP